MKLLTIFIKNRYGIQAQNADEATLKRLAAVSELPFDHLNGLFRKYNKIESLPNIKEDRLVGFHKSVDYFYKNCK